MVGRYTVYSYIKPSTFDECSDNYEAGVAIVTPTAPPRNVTTPSLHLTDKSIWVFSVFEGFLRAPLSSLLQWRWWPAKLFSKPFPICKPETPHPKEDSSKNSTAVLKNLVWKSSFYLLTVFKSWIFTGLYCSFASMEWHIHTCTWIYITTVLNLFFVMTYTEIRVSNNCSMDPS